MSGRNLSPYAGSLDKGLMRITCAVKQTAATTIAFQQWNPGTRTYSAAPASGFRGVKSVTRTATGLWTIVLQQPTQRLTGITLMPSLAGGLGACIIACNNTTITNENSTSSPQVGVALLSSTATAADPASGELIVLTLEFQDSTAS